MPLMKCVSHELFSGFQALVIGNMLLENMGKETCLDCLHFRHKGLNYYATYKRDGARFKESLEKQLKDIKNNDK